MKKKALFLCINNSSRSQMAEGFVKFYGKDKIEAYSAGSDPSFKVDQLRVEVMKEKKIYISKNESKGFDVLHYKDFDYVISMGRGDVCSCVPAKQRIDWEIENPKGNPKVKFRVVKHEIENRIKKFLIGLE